MVVAVLAVAVAAAAATAAQRFSTSVVLLRVAFTSPSAGVGLFETSRGPVSGSGPQSCTLYVRPTTDGGARFGAAGTPLSRTNCANGIEIGGLSFNGHGDLIEYGPGIAVSHNDGETWTRASMPGSVVAFASSGSYEYALVTNCPVSATRCRLTLVSSSDGGVTWGTARSQPPDRSVAAFVARQSESGDSTLLAANPVAGLVIALPELSLALAHPGKAAAIVERTTGAGWTSSQAPCVGGGMASELTLAPDGSEWLMCAGEPSAGSQLKGVTVSLDGGQSWSAKRPLPIGGYLDGAAALSSHTAFYIGDRSNLETTDDGGGVWRAFDRIGGDATGTAQVMFVDRDYGWAVAQGPYGVSSTLWRTGDGGVTWTRA